MVRKSSDRQWSRFGETDPYWAVLTSEEYRESNLTDENKRQFFKSGSVHLEKITKKIDDMFSIDFSPKKSIDFGCGVGRIVVKLAEISEQVTGVDISPGMISEAERNCEERGIENASFVQSSDSLDGLNGKFDFIHSFLVLQHINPNRGYRIVESLLDRLEDNGIAVLHFTIRGAIGKNGVFRSFFKTRVPLAHNFYNLFKGEGFFSPYMEIHHYDLGRIIEILNNKGMSEYFLEGFTDRFGTIGLFLFVRNQI